MMISLVIPVYNEELNIVNCYERIADVFSKLSVDCEIIYVNDGSRDYSIDIIKKLAKSDPRVKYMDFSRNFGHQVALTAGLKNASGEYLVFMDGDGQDPPEIIPILFEKANMGFDVVYCRRKSRRGESFFKKMSARYFYRLLNFLTDVDIPLDTGDFRMISRRVVETLKLMPEKNRYLRGQIAWLGFDTTYIEFDREPRFKGETKFSLSKMLKFAFDGIFGFSNLPLRLTTFLGLLVSLFAFLLIIYAVVQNYFGRTIVGWTSLEISILLLGGAQLISIGIIGEYLGRMNDNIKKRPDYIVKESNFTTD